MVASVVSSNEEAASGAPVDELDRFGAARLTLALSPAQQQVLEDLLKGIKVPNAAGRANVHRGTVNRWLLEDANFIAARNARLKEMIAEHHADIIALVPAMLATIRAAIENGDARLALQMLKLTLQMPHEHLSTRATVVAEQLETAHQQQAAEVSQTKLELAEKEENAASRQQAVDKAQADRAEANQSYWERFESANRRAYRKSAMQKRDTVKEQQIIQRIKAEVDREVDRMLNPGVEQPPVKPTKNVSPESPAQPSAEAKNPGAAAFE